MNNPGAIKGISSGYRRLDLTLDGLQPGAMIVLAARPGVGKTAALVNILTNICLEGTPVGMFSLEMPKSQLLERILYGMAGINSDDIRRGKPMTVGQQQHFTAAVRKITAAPLHIDDESSLTIDSIRARGRRMVREHGVKCIGVDYLQLVRSTTQQARGSREREVSEISAGLKSLAKELNIPVLVLAQLNRDVEKRAGNAQGKPVVSDLRDSGSIEQDADQIIMIHRPYMYKPDKHDPTEAQWIIGKTASAGWGVFNSAGPRNSQNTRKNRITPSINHEKTGHYYSTLRISCLENIPLFGTQAQKNENLYRIGNTRLHGSPAPGIASSPL